MPLFHPPRSLVARLRAYDPLLRVRWSDAKQRWLIERKVRRARLTYGDSPDPDVRQRFHDGYLHVFSVAANQLDDRVLKALGLNDMWRQGGAGAVNQALDAAAEDKERRDDRAQREDCRYLAHEMFNYQRRLAGGRVTVDENPLHPAHVNQGSV